MKIYFFIFIFVIASTTKQSVAQTNVYHPFPDSNASWLIECCGVVGPPPTPPSCNWIQHQVTGADTIIGSYTYKKVFDGSSFVGAYRQNIPNKKVYCINQLFQNTEYLLYDFALAVGDTFTARPLADCDSFSVVTSIDSILIGGGYRKKINFQSITCCAFISIIEGIGSEAGLFEHSCFEGWCGLCEYKNDSITFDYNIGSCNATVSEIFSIRAIYISPNPFSTQTTLHSEKVFNNATLTIYNSFGQQVKQITPINIGAGQTIILHRENLPSGIYFLRLTQDNATFATSKLVITSDE